MTKRINKPQGSQKPAGPQPNKQISFDISIAKQKIKDILASNGVPIDSIQTRLLSNFIDRIIESLKSNKPVNKDFLEKFFRSEVLQKQSGIDKSKINFGKISSEISQLRNKLPAPSNQSLILGAAPTTLGTSSPLGGEPEMIASQARLQLPQEEETILEKILSWASTPPAPSEVYSSPGFAEVRKEGVLSIIQLPKRTNPEAELKELIREMPEQELQGKLRTITNAIVWYTSSFIPAQQDISARFFNGEQIKGQEVIETLNNVIRSIDPNFNIREIINAEKTVTRSDLINLGNEVNLRILMPRNVFASSVEGGRLGVGFMLGEPETLLTPKGNSMPLHKIYPFIGEFGSAYSDHEMIIYPYYRDKNFGDILRNVEKNWVNYKSSLFQKTSFTTNPNIIASWVAVQFLEHSQDIIKDQRIDTINEELAHHDLHMAFKEKTGISFDTQDTKAKVEGLKMLLNPNSILYKELESIEQKEANPQKVLEKQEEFCHAISEIYAKAIALGNSPFPTFTLQDCIANSILTSEQLEHEPSQYAVARKYLAQFIWKELNNTPELQNVSREQWCAYFDTAIKGTDEASDKEAVKAFNRKLIELSPRIIAEHFIF